MTVFKVAKDKRSSTGIYIEDVFEQSCQWCTGKRNLKYVLQRVCCDRGIGGIWKIQMCLNKNCLQSRAKLPENKSGRCK